MGEVTKVVFLDIDGPMIPSTMFLIDRMCSFDRKFPATTIAALNELCARTGVKIVFNTTHNNPSSGVLDIDKAIVAHGLGECHLHPSDRHTLYPRLARDVAVKEWLARHPEVTDWIALDDARFTDDERLIWVDPDAGLHVGHINHAIQMMGGKPCLILI